LNNRNRCHALKTLFVSILCFLGLAGCATPSERFASAAANFGFHGFSLNSGIFDHQFYTNAKVTQEINGQVLHVYLDGDGTPWEKRQWIADDPTSRNSLILELMRQDKAAAILLGRPCYQGLNKTSTCHYKYWTSHRYSKKVVDSMAQVLKLWLNKHSFKQVVLIGYSGGGTLAVLMAPYIPEVKTIVTLAANLDVEAWSRYHGYNPLPESLNPAGIALNANLRQIHIAGLEDNIVPARIIKSYVDRQVNALYLPYANFDHHCCWVKEWASILRFL
jgi:pimeloyl-ACP methyl ester carboxylesterase